ncbi:hypothetical protein DAEQUDRAFT_770534 [Daedalea quercina L-15889]|uniref:Peroxin-3 n=1 Tax=Daedalea quercina L-15889 TaxID=1314783 RepID=A0A165KSB3_9APHY|nr:hypothetical protein DAEQUDRAFT_770534 [Daedalea quercina L-15889]
MLKSVTNYIKERKSGLQRAAGYVGGAYLLGQYVLGRLQDVRTTVMQDRFARENLRRRFEQNQQDISFTVMALLPTLGRHILEGMDVEGVTSELQSYSKSAKTSTEPQIPISPSESSLTSSMELVSRPQHPDHSENSSFSMLQSVQENGVPTPTDLSASSASWVDQFSSMQSSELANGSTQDSSADGPNLQMPHLAADVPFYDSNPSTSTSSSSSTAPEPPAPENGHAHPIDTPARSKAELWKEVKILTFTRTLTIIYSMTLLTLFTHIQLTILGRSKYIHSVIQAEQEERMREQMMDASIFSLLWNVDDAEGTASQGVDVISEETERKYLTLSWWILHVGWKDVGERVRRGVEEVFEGVSLKTKFTINDLFRLVSDVRRRVEYEVTFEGHERRINFMSTLLPPTSETLHHVLTQGGVPAYIINASDSKFEALLSETRTHIMSASFQHVLEACLDQATETLFSGLRKTVFSSVIGPLSFEEHDDEVRERLAAMLPGLARWCHLALEGLPNEMVDNLSSLRETTALSAIIYSSYEDRFS